MDNIIFKIIWKDENFIELKVTANSEYINAYQTCYVDEELLKNASDKINNYLSDYSTGCYLEFGQKTGNYTPAFSLNILPPDNYGHLKIEVDMEIADNNSRKHRCCFYVNCELGQLERFGKSLMPLYEGNEGSSVSLIYS